MMWHLSFAVVVLAALHIHAPLSAELAVGAEAPDITEDLCGPGGLTGRQFDLARDGDGKVVYLQFNNPTCPRCRYLITTVQDSVCVAFKDNPDVVFVQVAYAYGGYDANDIMAMIAATGCTQNVLAEDNGDAFMAYDITGIPYSFVIDRAGVIRYARGGDQISADEIADEIDAALTGAPAPPPLPCLELICSGTSFVPGDTVRIALELSGVADPFDAYALIRKPDGFWLSMTLSGALRPGIAPLAAGVRSHIHTARYPLVELALPSGIAPGEYEVIAGLGKPGTLDAFCENRAVVQLR